MLRRTIASILSSSDNVRSVAARSAASIRAVRSLAAVILRGLRNLSIRHQRRVGEVGPAPKQTSSEIARCLCSGTTPRPPELTPPRGDNHDGNKR